MQDPLEEQHIKHKHKTAFSHFQTHTLRFQALLQGLNTFKKLY